MLQRNFTTVDGFCGYIYQNHRDLKELEGEDYTGIVIIAYYDLMIDILNSMIKHTDLALSCADLTDDLYDGYADEYIMTITELDTISIEKAKCSNGVYKETVDFLTFVNGDCNSKIVTTHPKAQYVEFNIDKDKELVKNGRSQKCYYDENGNMIGFIQMLTVDNAHYSRSFHSDDSKMVDAVFKSWNNNLYGVGR